MSTYDDESFRIVVVPAIVEHHLTFGIGYHVTPRFSAHAGLVHALKKSVNESGTDITGQPVEMKSTLSENIVAFGFTWRF
ncbi:hypothetical protein [Desulfosoma caldarium]|uniref:hypothetical protein n=1 Tax=Desulfosoma caldarium TaxID=610254 RepID=UPI000F46027E|nr:hypothetical protein [Desulfosoma caldarium]